MPVKIIPIYFYTPPPFFTNFTTWALGRLQQHTKIYCRIYVPCDGPSEKTLHCKLTRAAIALTGVYTKAKIKRVLFGACHPSNKLPRPKHISSHKTECDLLTT